MAWRAGFSVRAHSSRRGAQLRSAATRAGSAENCIVKVVAFAWGSSRDSTTHAKLKGSSHPDSSQETISLGGSGALVNCGRCTRKEHVAFVGAPSFGSSVVLAFGEAAPDLAPPSRTT